MTYKCYHFKTWKLKMERLLITEDTHTYKLVYYVQAANY